MSELASHIQEDIQPLVEEIIHFRESDAEIKELARDAAALALADAGSRPDLIIYVSENDTDSSASLAHLADHLDLPTTEYLSVSGHDCGNLAPALRVAQDALHSGRHHRVLLVLADRAPSHRRILASGLSVFSDSAVACLVTSAPEGPGPQLRLDATAQQTTVQQIDRPTAQDGVMATVGIASKAMQALLTTLGVGREEFDHAVLPNYRPAAQKFLMAALKLPADKLMLGAVTELGHCFSGDILITLHERAGSGALRAGQKIVASVSGPRSWASMAFTIVPGNLDKEDTTKSETSHD
ncbi:3-oxoacyl-[acyl-carrier-protein] synthase III C-terminal domain-containing protein [Streptomyces avidinii]|uniref:3-oxoacyl-[acyl-carrier-protein] synthase III C-terminal domain-containing protein n=1 Tax=Streptomyces avidinii TaxID=1895 RepID=UPI00379053F0